MRAPRPTCASCSILPVSASHRRTKPPSWLVMSVRLQSVQITRVTRPLGALIVDLGLSPAISPLPGSACKAGGGKGVGGSAAE